VRRGKAVHFGPTQVFEITKLAHEDIVGDVRTSDPLQMNYGAVAICRTYRLQGWWQRTTFELIFEVFASLVGKIPDWRDDCECSSSSSSTDFDGDDSWSGGSDNDWTASQAEECVSAVFVCRRCSLGSQGSNHSRRDSLGSQDSDDASSQRRASVNSQGERTPRTRRNHTEADGVLGRLLVEATQTNENYFQILFSHRASDDDSDNDD